MAAVYLVALIITLGLTGCSGSMNASEKMMWSTYPLATRKGSATGFVINHRDPFSHGRIVPVMFTSAHLIETMGKGPLLIGIRRPHGETSETETALLVFIPPKMSGKEHFYVRHPEYDLVAFALQIPEEFNGSALMSSFLDEGMLAHNGKPLRSGVEVSYFGYPEVLPGTEGGFPVLRSGRVASYPVGSPHAHGRYVINSVVYPGDSGAPVIVSNPGRHPELAGMIIQRIGPESQRFANLAIAVDANALRETLKLLERSETRALDVKKQSSPENSTRAAADTSALWKSGDRGPH